MTIRKQPCGNARRARLVPKRRRGPEADFGSILCHNDRGALTGTAWNPVVG